MRVAEIYGYEGAGHSVGLHSRVAARPLELGLHPTRDGQLRRGESDPQRIGILRGTPCREPVFNLDAVWIEESERKVAELSGKLTALQQSLRLTVVDNLFLGSETNLAAAALLACYIPARRAAVVRPPARGSPPDRVLRPCGAG